MRSGRRTRRALAIAAFALTIAGTGAAWAHHTDITDPNDTKGLLDIRQVKVGHHAGDPVEFTVITASTWKPLKIWDRGYIVIALDTIGDEREEYYVLIRAKWKDMEASLWWVPKDFGKPDVHVRALHVFRKTTDGVSVLLPPLWKLRFGEARTFYRWWVVSTLANDKCGHTCIDRAPNVRTVEQPKH
jgi:hypothetical protein